MTGQTVHKAGRREWIGLAVLALPTLLLSLDMSVLHLAVPYLAADLRPSGTELLWIIDIYGFMIAGFLVTMGTLGDRIGRRRLLLVGAAAFALASVAAAFAASPGMLIAARAALGIAGATLMPSTLALISNMFTDPAQRASAIAVWMSCFMGGMVCGPVVGGVLLEYFWWGSVFLMGVPVMVLLLATAPALLPDYRDPDACKLDPRSVLLSLGAVLPVIYALKELAVHGPSLATLLAGAVGLAAGVVFVRRQRVLEHPMLDLALFRVRKFSAALGIMFVGTLTMGGVFLLAGQFLQFVEGLSALQAGIALLPQALAVVAGSMIAPRLTRRFRPEFVLGFGMLLAAAGMLLFLRIDGIGGTALVVAGFCVAAFGMGPQGVICTEMVMSSVSPRRAGAASAMSETCGEFGIALGIAVFGSVGAAVYQGSVTVPGGAGAAAGESMAGAVRAAQTLPADAGAALLDSANQAFTSGLHVVAGIAAAVLVVFAIVGMIVLRGRSADDEPVAEPAGATELAEQREQQPVPA